MSIKILLAMLIGLSFLGCGKKNAADDETLNAVEATVESGVSMISGLSDDQSGTSYASKSETAPKNIWQLLLGEKAYADNCTRAIFQSCVSGVKTTDFDSCQIAGTLRSITGNVTLSFSDSGCSMASVGNSVNRTYDLDISGPRGGVVSITSATNADYNGNSYGGGGVLEKTSGGWEIEILGRHSALSKNGRQFFNISTRTLSNVQITGSLDRSNRVVNSGQIEVNHNLAKFTALFQPNNLTWTSSCCHPVSGSLGVTYSGSKTGTATVTFNGCGTAELDEDGQKTDLTLSYCE
jgi:hypothetical protein